ncbi:putative beta-glucanosyltransferase gel2 protein [Dipodascopsis tothii]|uniref:putative beta-glucanosyltransferase gel2 protein n=1 Tax=Dipodascopsis tothii TaxID=44089 RepID=UPI0034CE7717
MKFLLGLASVLGLLSQQAWALQPVSIKGNTFVDASGNPFVIVGVDYQPGGSSAYNPALGKDVLSDANVCLRDAYVLQQLGVNTIRIYTIDPDVNHDACVSIFNAAGIYILLDVNSALAGESIARDNPGPTYTKSYLRRVFKVIDNFKGYPNTLGFFSGNEIVNDAASAAVSPPYIRAVQRDMKQYIANHADRTIPVGYSAADDTKLRRAGWEYLQCGGGDDAYEISRSDFYGLNSYEWCSGISTWATSGYSNLISTFKNSSIPLVFSEYGCNAASPRTFTEVDDGVYDKRMLGVFDGGLVYEYSNEDNGYGLVNIGADGTVEYRDDFMNLQDAYQALNYSSWFTKDSIKTAASPACSKSYIQSLAPGFNASFALPASPARDLIASGSGSKNVGRLVPLNGTYATTYAIYDADGNEIDDPAITVVSSSNSYMTSTPRSSTRTATATPTASSATRVAASATATSSAVVVANKTSAATAAATSDSAADAVRLGSAGSLVLAVVAAVFFAM